MTEAVFKKRYLATNAIYSKAETKLPTFFGKYIVARASQQYQTRIKFLASFSFTEVLHVDFGTGIQ